MFGAPLDTSAYDVARVRRLKRLNLAEPVERETPSGVRARSQHFSASALNAYAECERKWYYRYVCASVEDKGSSAATYGTAFHLALEDFHAVYPRPRAEDEPGCAPRSPAT